MRILITGGSGLIGTHLIPALLSLGHSVVNLGRNMKSPMIDPHFHHLVWNGKTIPTEAGDIDAVINLAGAAIADHAWTTAYKKVIADSRFQATKACADFIRNAEHKPVVFLSGSAVGYYGTKNPKTIDETAPNGSDFLGVTCKEWENLAQNTGVRTVMLRTGVVMAAEGGAFPQLIKPFKFYAGGFLGTGEQGFPWIHIDDVVKLILFALSDDRVSGALNLTAPEILNNKQFGHVLGHLIGKPSNLPVPAFILKSMMGERAMILTEGQFVTPQKALDLGFSFKYPDAKSGMKALLDVYNRKS